MTCQAVGLLQARDIAARLQNAISNSRISKDDRRGAVGSRLTCVQGAVGPGNVAATACNVCWTPRMQFLGRRYLAETPYWMR